METTRVQWRESCGIDHLKTRCRKQLYVLSCIPTENLLELSPANKLTTWARIEINKTAFISMKKVLCVRYISMTVRLRELNAMFGQLYYTDVKHGHWPKG